MIFVSGIHGVGKSYFCELVKKRININTYTASSLIAAKKKTKFPSDKLIPDINDNQQYLLQAVNELRLSDKNFILDGHFCLLNAQGQIQRISFSTFNNLKPEAILLLTEDPEIIAKRRHSRDNQNISVQSIQAFQNFEEIYAKEIARNINANLFISKGYNDLEKALEFIKSC